MIDLGIDDAVIVAMDANAPDDLQLGGKLRADVGMSSQTGMAAVSRLVVIGTSSCTVAVTMQPR